MANCIYRVSFTQPSNHQIHVRLKLAVAESKQLHLSLPAWIPGSYMIRDFARNITEIRATQNGRPLELRKLDKQSWQTEIVSGEVEVSYEIFAFDLSVRSAHVDDSHAFFNGSSVFLQVDGFDSGELLVEIEKPEQAPWSGWHLYTTLSKRNIDTHGFGLYSASSYKDLIDHPVEAGNAQAVDFDVAGIPHQLVLSGQSRPDFNALQVASDLVKICGEHMALFADRFPASQYKFLTMVTANGYGGLEHKSSTSLVCSPDDLPGKRDQEQTSSYRKFLGLCSHEYFHLWNVKRIKPEKFINADLSKEVHTQLLWAFEGITSYYDDLALLRSGCVKLEHYLDLLAQTITRYMRGRGRARQTVVDSSFDAWTKFYKQDENAINAIVSYYTKGALIALGLDMTMRQMTQDSCSLDDLMRRLWQEHGKIEKGVPENGVERLAVSMAGDSLTTFFDKCLRTTDELPLQQWLAEIGVGVRFRQAKNDSDQGGYADTALADKETTPQQFNASIGVLLKPGTSAELQAVYKDSPAELAGLSPGDEIIAVAGVRVESKSFFNAIANLEIGQTVDIHAFRRGCLRHFNISPTAAATDVCELYLLTDDDRAPLQLERRTNWMTSNIEKDSV